MIDLSEVQSLIVRPRGAPGQVELIFLRALSREGLKELCQRATDGSSIRITSADDVDAGRPGAAPGDRHIALGLTAAAFRLLGASTRAYEALSPSFTEGMLAAAGRLGDVDDSAPPQWHWPFGPKGRPPTDPPGMSFGLPVVHAVLIVQSGQGATPFVVPPIQEVVVVGSWKGARRADSREPFGFIDGISDPKIEGAGPGRTDAPVPDGDGVWDAGVGRWRAVRAGEALLGHTNEGGEIAGHPDAAPLERNGSYLVIRRLEQHVKQFHAACAAWAEDLGPEWLTPAAPEADGGDGHGDGDGAADPAFVPQVGDKVAEQLLGRRRSDGSPLGRDDPQGNRFLYRSKEFPPVCLSPAAHIRRANPRDDMTFAADVVPRHVIFRRGYPYADGDEQGLLFMACCADLRRQFEFVQARWLGDGDRFGLGPERDGLVGSRPLAVTDPPQAAHQVSIPVDGARERRSLPAFVSTRGGEYVLLPSWSTLVQLGSDEPCP